MDKILEARYQALFDLYGAGANIAVIHTKEMLSDWITKRPEQLRSDAAYFLLVNFDEMIIRPHAGYVPTPGRPYGSRMDYFRDQRESDILKQVETALMMILETLPSEPLPVSAHEVMKSIDKNWDELQKLFGWG